jgi:hypothetical protein
MRRTFSPVETPVRWQGEPGACTFLRMGCIFRIVDLMFNVHGVSVAMLTVGILAGPAFLAAPTEINIMGRSEI